jgi:hypothetical protein
LTAFYAVFFMLAVENRHEQRRFATSLALLGSCGSAPAKAKTTRSCSVNAQSLHCFAQLFPPVKTQDRIALPQHPLAAQ